MKRTSESSYSPEKCLDYIKKNPDSYLCFKDSIEAGNCEPGTKHFQKKYGIKEDEILFSELYKMDLAKMLNNKAFRLTIYQAYRRTKNF